ncbi:MAG TPA: hypothetical protein VEX86_18900 [Longimicrobium sp.]|nr:hypothetical protein [Longimicrobium sp.]
MDVPPSNDPTPFRPGPAPAATPPAAAAPVPVPVRPRSWLRDAWVLPGLAALAVGTVFAIVLYRAAPQSAGEVRSAAMVAVAPDAFTPRVSRARERISAAQRARAAGDTAGAIARYAEAEEEALTARQHTADTTQTRTATELWATIVLDRAELMLASGAGPWYRADNNHVLAEALAAVKRVQAVPLTPATRARAAAVAERLERQMRPGPLEWIPR